MSVMSFIIIICHLLYSTTVQHENMRSHGDCAYCTYTYVAWHARQGRAAECTAVPTLGCVIPEAYEISTTVHSVYYQALTSRCSMLQLCRFTLSRIGALTVKSLSCCQPDVRKRRTKQARNVSLIFITARRYA